MKAVNLFPRDLEQERKAPPLPVVVACVGAVVAAAVVAVGYLNASHRVGAEKRALADAQAQIAALPQPPAPPATVTSLPQERAARVGALASALAERVPWDRILREVSLVLPSEVWLTSLDATTPTPAAAAGTPAPAPSTTTPTGFVLNGFTYSQTSVARLLARLALVPDLQDVSLTSSTQTELNKRPVVSFAIAGNVHLPGATS